MTITQTTIVLQAGASQVLVPANPARLYLQWMNVGLNPMTVSPIDPAVISAGMNYEGAFVAGSRGGAETYSGSTVPTNGFSAISGSGTTVIVWEGQ